MKGQFFLLGVFIFLSLFYAGMNVHFSPSLARSGLQPSHSHFVDDAFREMPICFNSGLSSGSAAGTLSDFTMFLVQEGRSLGLETGVLWCSFTNTSGGTIATSGNMLGYAVNLTLNVSGSVKGMVVGNGSVNSTVFSSVPDPMDISLSFNTTESQTTTARTKAALYRFIEASAGEEKIVKGGWS